MNSASCCIPLHCTEVALGEWPLSYSSCGLSRLSRSASKCCGDVSHLVYHVVITSGWGQIVVALLGNGYGLALPWRGAN